MSSGLRRREVGQSYSTGVRNCKNAAVMHPPGRPVGSAPRTMRIIRSLYHSMNLNEHASHPANASQTADRSQSTTLEPLDVVPFVPGGASLARLQTSLDTALLSARGDCTLASLRVVRVALRSSHVDAASARKVSRRNGTVVGVVEVAATADGVTALVDVTDVKERSALEVRVGRVLLNMTGRKSDALLCGSSRARNVLRNILETHRRDLHGE